MDYEAIDRDMSSWVVSCERDGRRIYLVNRGTGGGPGVVVDFLDQAQRYRWQDQAADAADLANESAAVGFFWEPMRVAEMMASK